MLKFIPLKENNTIECLIERFEKDDKNNLY